MAITSVLRPYTHAHTLPLCRYSNNIHTQKLSYDSPRYKLTPERATPLQKWFDEHRDHPYPTRHDKIVLCQETNLTFTQVSCYPQTQPRHSIDIIEGEMGSFADLLIFIGKRPK